MLNCTSVLDISKWVELYWLIESIIHSSKSNQMVSLTHVSLSTARVATVNSSSQERFCGDFRSKQLLRWNAHCSEKYEDSLLCPAPFYSGHESTPCPACLHSMSLESCSHLGDISAFRWTIMTSKCLNLSNLCFSYIWPHCKEYWCWQLNYSTFLLLLLFIFHWML